MIMLNFESGLYNGTISMSNFAFFKNCTPVNPFISNILVFVPLIIYTNNDFVDNISTSFILLTKVSIVYVGHFFIVIM